jgi:hypothetical protein
MSTANTESKKSDASEKDEISMKDDTNEKYLNQLNPLENEALMIAKRQLKTSFDLEKSIGYLKYKTK